MPICKLCHVDFKRKYGQGAIPTICGKCRETKARYKKVIPGESKTICKTCTNVFVMTKPRDYFCASCREYHDRKKQKKPQAEPKKVYSYQLTNELGRCILDHERNWLNNKMLEYVQAGKLIKKYDPEIAVPQSQMYANIEFLNNIFNN